MPTDWSLLTHAYGPAGDVPPLFEQLADPDLARDAWHELWSRLCHQGTIYPASFAAVPVLAEIATEPREFNTGQAVGLASSIVAGETQLHEAGYVRAHYPEAIAHLHRVTERALTEQPFDGTDHEYLHPLEALLAFEGVPVWSDALSLGHHMVHCPSCANKVEIDLGARPPGTRRVNPRSRVWHVNSSKPTVTEIHPTAPDDLPPLAARLHRLAVDAGQDVAARHLTYLFGRTTCPDCGGEFSVPAQVEAFVP